MPDNELDPYNYIPGLRTSARGGVKFEYGGYIEQGHGTGDLSPFLMPPEEVVEHRTASGELCMKSTTPLNREAVEELKRHYARRSIVRNEPQCPILLAAARPPKKIKVTRKEALDAAWAELDEIDRKNGLHLVSYWIPYDPQELPDPTDPERRL